MNFVSLAAWAQTAFQDHRGGADWGFVAVAAGLVFAAVQAHRFWRQTIRLEDQLEATRKDLAFTLERYREAFKVLEHPVAFVDRASGLVAEVSPAWQAQGLPEVGRRLGAGDEALQQAWAALPAPAADGRVAGPTTLTLQGRPFEVRPLAGASLGMILVQPR